MDKRILVVEDDPVTQLLYKKLLEKEGFIVDITSNVTDALNLYNQNEYMLFIVDVILNDKLGGDILIDSNLRPMLVITGLSLNKMYSTYYLRKPLRNKELVTKVYDIIKKEYGDG